MKTTKSLLSVLALSFFVLSAYAAGGGSSGDNSAAQSSPGSTSMGSTAASPSDTGAAGRDAGTDANGNAINKSYGSGETDKDQSVKHHPNTNAEDQNAPNTSGTPEGHPQQ